MRALALVAAAAAVFVVVLPAWTEDEDLGRLRADLVGARHADELGRALDAAVARIGERPGFTDHAAFADWLGELPEPLVSHVSVRLRRGWGYLAADRRGDARPLFEGVVSEDGPEAAVATGYLGEIARREGEFKRAFELLAAAARDGWRDSFVVDSARKAAFQMHEATPSKAFDGLPDYASALEGFLDVFDDAGLHGTLARWLLDDHAAYARPGSERARLWANAAAPHAMVAAVRSAEGGADARLAYDAARALPADDAHPLYFDLLAEAWRLGDRPADDTHEIPQVVAHLAEAALEEGRFELAHRLARQRLAISDSPLARRVLSRLPPDLGD